MVAGFVEKSAPPLRDTKREAEVVPGGRGEHEMLEVDVSYVASVTFDTEVAESTTLHLGAREVDGTLCEFAPPERKAETEPPPAAAAVVADRESTTMPPMYVKVAVSGENSYPLLMDTESVAEPVQSALGGGGVEHTRATSEDATPDTIEVPTAPSSESKVNLHTGTAPAAAKPLPVTVMGVPPTTEPKTGEMDDTCEAAR
jgi:hypothetical protein